MSAPRWESWRRPSQGEPEAPWEVVGTTCASMEDALDGFRRPDPARRPLDLLRLTESGHPRWFGFARDDGRVAPLPPLITLEPCPALHSVHADEGYVAVARRCGADLGAAWAALAHRADWRAWLAAKAGLEPARLAAVVRDAVRHALVALPPEGAAPDLDLLAEADAMAACGTSLSRPELFARAQRYLEMRTGRVTADVPAAPAVVWEAAATAVSYAVVITYDAAVDPAADAGASRVIAPLRAAVRVAAYATELPGAPPEVPLLLAAAAEERWQADLVGRALPLCAVLLAGTDGPPAALGSFGWRAPHPAVRP